jgi:hypothetical protein
VVTKVWVSAFMPSLGFERGQSLGWLWPPCRAGTRLRPQIINARGNMGGMVPIQVLANGFCAGVFPATLD